MTSITLKGREVPLLYTTYEMKTIQEEIAPIGQALKIVLGRNPDDENDMSLYGGAAHIEAASKLIRILGNAGLEEEGKEPDLTDKWILRNIKPGMVIVYVMALVAVISDGNKIEAATPAEEQGPVDEGLEEENAKKQPGN
jgi:hypothetical protein